MIRKIRALPIAKLVADIPRRRIATLVALGVLGGLSEAALLILIVRVATIAMSGANPTDSIAQLLPTDLGTMVVVGLIAGVATLVFQVLGVLATTATAAQRAIGMRERLLARYLGSSLSGPRTVPPGVMQEVFSQQIMKGSEGLVLAGSTASAASNLIVLLTASILLSPPAALILVVVGGGLALLLIPLNRSIAKSSRKMVAGALNLMNTVSIFVRMAVEIRVFGVQKRVETKAGEQIRAVAADWQATRQYQQIAPISFRVFVLTLTFAVIGTVATLVPSAITAVATIALLLVRALAYVQVIQNNSQQMEELAAYWDSAKDTFGALAPDSVRWGSRTMRELGEITLEQASFSYDGERTHLDQVMLEATRGDSISISGPSGGGKSTLLKILLRLSEPSEGSYIANGRDAREFERNSWYSRIAYLPQEIRLIPGTLRDNVAFLRDVNDDEVHDAIRRAALVLDEHTFPAGLDTSIEEEGRNLSGGQRQRIGLARCLLRTPDLLILDEPTSALDAETERSVAGTIAKLRPDLITVTVTHRPEASRSATALYSMRNGQLGLREASAG